MEQISIDDFKKVEIRIGKVVKCEKLENADKLLKLTVDFGEFQRQILSAIADWYKPEDLQDKKLPFLVNLQPRMMRGEESQGMLMAMDTEDKPVLLVPSEDVEVGTLIV